MDKPNAKPGRKTSYKKLPHRGHRILTNSNPKPLPIDDEQLAKLPPRNLLEFWEKYLRELKSNSPGYVSANYTVITRVIVPYLGGPVPSNPLRTEELDKAAARRFLQQRPITDLKVVLQNAEHFFDEQGWKNPKKRKNLNFHLKKMVEFALERNWLQPDPENPELIYRLKEAHGARVRQDMKDYRSGERKSSETVMLGCFDKDFVAIPKSKVPKVWLNWRFVLSPVGLSMLQIAFVELEPNWYLANPDFDREIMEFAEFMDKKLELKEATWEADVQHICRLLGWMYRKKNLAVAEVRLAKVVPFIQMKFKLSECVKDGMLDPMLKLCKEAMANEQSEELGKEAAALVEEYIDWGNVSHASAVQNYNAVINLAKFTYHLQAKSDDFKSRDAFDNIPLIKVFKEKRRTHERKTRTQTKTTTEKQAQVLSYPQVIEVLEKARFEATLEVKHYQRSNRYRRGRPKIEKIPRKDTGIAQSFQKFIILALMLSCLPRRPKEYYQAEIGKTLLKGGFEDGLFVPVEEMKHPEKAKYYLCPEDYKTIKTYGKVGIPLGNTTFPDGTQFYDYLDLWINKWRKVLLGKEKHNFLFVQHGNGKPLTGTGFSKKVKHIFWRFAKVSMSPHKLRHSFETYSQEKGLTEAERQGSILAMGHSQETKRKYYDLREKDKVMQPALDFNQRHVENLLRRVDRSKLVESMNNLDEDEEDEE